MVGIVVTGHGNFATGLESSLKLIYGGSSHIKFVDSLRENPRIH